MKSWLNINWLKSLGHFNFNFKIYSVQKVVLSKYDFRWCIFKISANGSKGKLGNSWIGRTAFTKWCFQTITAVLFKYWKRLLEWFPADILSHCFLSTSSSNTWSNLTGARESSIKFPHAFAVPVQRERETIARSAASFVSFWSFSLSKFVRHPNSSRSLEVPAFVDGENRT